MLKESEISGKANRRRLRKLPKIPVPSEFKRAPKGLPINFYDPSWFNQVPFDQKRIIANSQQVAFLPNAALSLCPVRHPDEKLGDTQFTGKYRDILVEAYHLSDEEEGGFDEEDGSDSDTSINLEAASNGTGESEESDMYDEGEYGDLYEDKPEEKGGEAADKSDSDSADYEVSASAGKGKARVSEDSDDEDDAEFSPED